MTREEIIRLMKECCDPEKAEPFMNDFWTITQEELELYTSRIIETFHRNNQ